MAEADQPSKVVQADRRGGGSEGYSKQEDDLG